MVKVLKIAIYFLFCLGFAFSALAATPLDVVINEIAWMGTKTSYSDEWIELYNTTNQTINLDGWILKAEDGTPGIILAGSLPAKGFFILERTDEDTLPEILADQIYSGALENNGEDLKLLDNFGNLIDSVDCSDGWFEGDNETKQTMERKDSKLSGSYPDNWQTSQNLGGTPKAENSEQKTMNNKQETVLGRESPSGTVPQSSPKNLEESGSPPTYLSGIFINEILPSPEGPDAEEEWIEIFNENDFKVDLSGWQLRDTTGRTNTYTFPEETKIPAQEFLVFKRPITKIVLNNDGDGLKLINPTGGVINEVSFGKTEKGRSYNKTASGWAWSSYLTPGSPNTILQPDLEIEKEKFLEFGPEKESAGIGEQISEKNLLPFLVASGIAIFSGIIILILKRKLVRSQKNSKII